MPSLVSGKCPISVWQVSDSDMMSRKRAKTGHDVWNRHFVDTIWTLAGHLNFVGKFGKR